jgi:hypothetical protein
VDFVGATIVTVADQANAADKKSTTFTLHVLADNIFANGLD